MIAKLSFYMVLVSEYGNLAGKKSSAATSKIFLFAFPRRIPLLFNELPRRKQWSIKLHNIF